MLSTLCDLSANQQAKIIEFHSNDDFILRLKELGLLRQSIIKVIRKSPFAKVLEIQVRQSRIVLRLSQAKFIFVEPFSEDTP
jgi:ferrous iron transport protein A/ferrous iron transport protein B